MANNGRYPYRGPIRRRRPDRRIYEDVCDALDQTKHIDTSDIDVQVENGEVTLSGVVDSRQVKRRCEEIVERIPGVKDVHNRLEIHKTPPDLEAVEDTIRHGQIFIGMDVAGSDGRSIGTIKRIQEQHIVIERNFAPALCVPYNACKTVLNARLYLTISSPDVDRQPWNCR